jgi:hypothetical protein
VDQYGKSHEDAAEEVRAHFLNVICGPDKDTHFYVGTILAHPQSWVIIGVFYPKAQWPDGDSTPPLFEH